MLTEDHLLRQINLALAVLMQIIGFKKAGQHKDALKAIDQALESLTGLRAGLLKMMDDESLLQALALDSPQQPERLRLVSDLLREEADVLEAQGRQEEAHFSLGRALHVALEAGFVLEEEAAAGLEKVESLYRRMPVEGLSVELFYRLSDYFELAERYDLSSQAWTSLLAAPEAGPEAHQDAGAYYRRLLEKTDAELSAGHFNRESAQQALASLNA